MGNRDGNRPKNSMPLPPKVAADSVPPVDDASLAPPLEGSEPPELTAEEIEAAKQAEQQAAHDLLPQNSLNIPPKDSEKNAEVPRKKGKGIQVVALRDGFFDNERKKPGDIFSIQSEQQMGKWMKKI